MKTSQAKKRMQTIEKSIEAMKDAGFSIYCVDNDILVLESPKTQDRNAKTFKKAEDIDSSSAMIDGNYKQSFDASINNAGGLTYDYEITL